VLGHTTISCHSVKFMGSSSCWKIRAPPLTQLLGVARPIYDLSPPGRCSVVVQEGIYQATRATNTHTHTHTHTHTNTQVHSTDCSHTVHTCRKCTYWSLNRWYQMALLPQHSGSTPRLQTQLDQTPVCCCCWQPHALLSPHLHSDHHLQNSDSDWNNFHQMMRSAFPSGMWYSTPGHLHI